MDQTDGDAIRVIVQVTSLQQPNAPANEPTMLSTAQAAKALGVGVSSVKRWVDDGILPAYKTVGGHRKLCLSDVLRAARNQDLPHLDLRQLPIALPDAARQSKSRNDPVEELFEQLTVGNVAAAEAGIRSAYFSGMSIAELADALIRPAMERIGEAWHANQISVFHEHRATHICLHAIVGLKRFLDDRIPSAEAPLAVGGSPESHWHSLANYLAELVMLEAGWRVVNLGANTPFESFRDAIRELRPQLLWLSINPSSEPDTLSNECQRLIRFAQRAGSVVAVGGIGVTPNLRQYLPTARFGERLAQLAELAREIHPLPKPRRRGRPSPEGRS